MGVPLKTEFSRTKFIPHKGRSGQTYNGQANNFLPVHANNIPLQIFCATKIFRCLKILQAGDFCTVASPRRPDRSKPARELVGAWTDFLDTEILV